MKAQLARRFGRVGGYVGAELADLSLLGPRVFARQHRDPTGKFLAGAVRETWYRELWTEAAERVGATVNEGPGSLVTVERDGRTARIWGHFVELDDPVTLELVGDKPAVHELLTRCGLRVPDHRVLPLDRAMEALDLLELHPQLVVKPAAATGAGSGVTGGVMTRRDFRRALVRSARHDQRRVLVEAQAEGSEYRVLVMRGEPIAIVERRRPGLVGDGKRRVAELIGEENARRRRCQGDAGLFALTFDLDAALSLAAADQSFTSVPQRGENILVKNSTSQGGDGDATARRIDDPAVGGVVADAVSAASALEADYVSVESITPDPSVGSAVAGVVLEVNTTPGIAQHHVVDNPGQTEHTAAKVVHLLLS